VAFRPSFGPQFWKAGRQPGFKFPPKIGGRPPLPNYLRGKKRGGKHGNVRPLLRGGTGANRPALGRYREKGNKKNKKTVEKKAEGLGSSLCWGKLGSRGGPRGKGGWGPGPVISRPPPKNPTRPKKKKFMFCRPGGGGGEKPFAVVGGGNPPTAVFFSRFGGGLAPVRPPKKETNPPHPPNFSLGGEVVTVGRAGETCLRGVFGPKFFVPPPTFVSFKKILGLFTQIKIISPGGASAN